MVNHVDRAADGATVVSPAVAEALFSTAHLDIVMLTPELASQADQPVLASPKFFQIEYEGPPEAGFAQELLEAPAPPGVSKAATFVLGLLEKGGGYVGLAHLVLGYPTDTTMFLGLLLIAEPRQRKGHGKEFLEGIYNWARPQGIGFIRARVNPASDIAKAFFDKVGFTDLPGKLSTGHQIWERRLPAVED